MDVLAGVECVNQNRIIGQVSEDAELDLRVVGADQHLAGRRHEGGADAPSFLAPNGDVLEIRIGRRQAAGGSDGTRPVKNAIKRLVNRVGIAAGTMTVYESDDATGAWTSAVTTTAGNPISDNDPV